MKLNASQLKDAEITPRVAQIETSTTQAITKQTETWGTLLKRLDVIVSLGNQLAEVSFCFYSDIRSDLSKRPSAS